MRQQPFTATDPEGAAIYVTTTVGPDDTLRIAIEAGGGLPVRLTVSQAADLLRWLTVTLVNSGSSGSRGATSRPNTNEHNADADIPY